jgi:hypothetical protein
MGMQANCAVVPMVWEEALDVLYLPKVGEVLVTNPQYSLLSALGAFAVTSHNTGSCYMKRASDLATAK